ncbi:HNH endonuclease [bacterium]|nr:HNH endonuclease [bacterium]
MPYKCGRPCPGRGPRYRSCPNLIRGSETCCSECKPYEKAKTRQYDEQRDESPGRQFLHSTVWRRTRDAKLARDPLCERCLKMGRDEAAVLVHHVDHNELNNPADGSNHESLCNTCHELEHKNDRWVKCIVTGNEGEVDDGWYESKS